MSQPQTQAKPGQQPAKVIPAKPAASAQKLTPEEAKAVKTARFKKIASGRSTSIVKNLQLIENCSNKNVYEYTQEQIDKMFSAIEKALSKCKDKFVEKTKEGKLGKVDL